MGIQQLPPAPVTRLSGAACGVDDVGEQDGREDSVLVDLVTATGDELLHRVERTVRVAEPGKMIIPGLLEKLRIRYVFGEIAAVEDRQDSLVGSVDNERRDLEVRQDVTHVDLGVGLHQRAGCARAAAHALVSSPNATRALVVGEAGQKQVHQPALTPAFAEFIEEPVGLFPCPTRRVLRRLEHSCRGPHQDQPASPVRVGGRVQDAHRSTLRETAEKRRSRVDGIHHRPHVVNALLERRHADEGVRHARAALVEHDQAAE